MDLNNMRENGVRELVVLCEACGDRANINADAYPGNLTVKSFERRMRCSACGSAQVDARPAWGNRPLQIPKP